MNFVIIGILVVLFIAVLVFVIKAAKEWRWFHIVTVLLTMLLAIILIFPTAGALKSRNAWHEIKEKLEIRRDKAVEEEKVIKNGDPNDADAGRGVIALRQELAKVGIEAGRRWRGLRMTNPNIQSIQLTKPAGDALPPGVAAPPGDADDAPAPAPAGPLVPTGLVIYGFAESGMQVDGVDLALPTYFLGEFSVTASNETTVTLQPTGPLEPGQQQRISGGQANSWSLYELLPLDAHDPFIAEGSSESDENVFGRVDDQLVSGLLPWPQANADRLQELQGKVDAGTIQSLSVAEKREYFYLTVRNRTVQNYLHDGARSTQDDSPLSIWVKVEFTKNYEIDVDSDDVSGALEGGFFDGIGRAVDSRLKRIQDEGKVKFKKGDLIVVKEEEAKRLIDEEDVARLIDTFYVRPLNDYRFVLRRIRLRLAELAIRERELIFEDQVITEAQTATTAMFAFQQNDKVKLEQDLTQHQLEVKAITGYRDEIKGSVDETRKTLNRLYQENLQYEKQIQRIHQTLINTTSG